MKLIIITPTRNSKENMLQLCASIDCQKDQRYEHIIIDDASDESKMIDESELPCNPKRTVIKNSMRKWALRNIVNYARLFDDEEIIIATVDGDDELIGDDVVSAILGEYENSQIDVLWTAHEWDIKRDMCVSRDMPQKIDPYSWPWCTSHLRTFRSTLLKNISDENFKDAKGEWFRRGYDQALMLPLLKVARDRKFLNKKCYLYKLDSVAIPLSDRAGSEVEQVHNIAFIRARGFIQ